MEGKIQSIQTPNEIFIFQQQTDLNLSQNKAIAAVGQNALTFIKGPPGCGKTHLIGRLCKLLYYKKFKKVLVGAVSNTGVVSILSELFKQLVSQ